MGIKHEKNTANTDKYWTHNRQSLLLNIQLSSSSTDGQNHLLVFCLVGQIIIIRSKVVTHPATALAFRRMRLGCQSSEVILTNPRGAENAHHTGVQLQIPYTIPTSDRTSPYILAHAGHEEYSCICWWDKICQNCITCCIYF